jgi:hypothetical protein
MRAAGTAEFRIFLIDLYWGLLHGGVVICSLDHF